MLSGPVVGIGDSITWGSDSSDPPATSYVGYAARLLGTEAINLGIPAAFTDRMTYEVASVPETAAAVLLCAGTNDVGVAAGNANADEAVAKVRAVMPTADALFAALRERLPTIPLVVVTVRDLGRARADYPNTTADGLTAASRAWNAHIRALAARADAALVDVEHDAQWYVHDEYAPGGIHPLDACAERLAHAVVAALGAILTRA
ncbi:MAG: SGNH/GDSL hydrolase family protein [Candidatus Eremiobacteraeota bacterium]|nr:SGNH/GDSL hydrolase family protein [Candidatus Eremiobacteraeota bacterium]